MLKTICHRGMIANFKMPLMTSHDFSRRSLMELKRSIVLAFFLIIRSASNAFAMWSHQHAYRLFALHSQGFESTRGSDLKEERNYMKNAYRIKDFFFTFPPFSESKIIPIIFLLFPYFPDLQDYLLFFFYMSLIFFLPFPLFLNITAYFTKKNAFGTKICSIQNHFFTSWFVFWRIASILMGLAS